MNQQMTRPQMHLLFWGATALLFLSFVWIFKGVLTPFVLGIAIAYLLNPVVNALVKIKLPRLIAVSIILLSFFMFVLAVTILAAPPLAREAAALAESIPGYVDQLVEYATPYLTKAQEQFGGDYIEKTKALLQSNAGKIIQITAGLASGLANGGQAVVGFFATLFLTPLVAFMLMIEWPRIVSWVNDLIPRKNEKIVTGLLADMNAKVAGFVRGQITVAFFLGAIYAIALSIAGLNYGFLIGIAAGFLSIIPMVGSTLGLLVSVVVAWFQMGTIEFVGIVAAIFVVGQIVEGNILTPKLVGDSVGLHALWVLFALMAGASVLGILGMLLAVPVAAVIGVLLSFAILQYKNSSLYAVAAPKKMPTKKKAIKKVAKKTIKKSIKKKTTK
ncbi:MAG: AI-2E family transporter [Micavibrio sp.]|nr:AI-2E family transporter [Micavibrio sp.]